MHVVYLRWVPKAFLAAFRGFWGEGGAGMGHACHLCMHARFPKPCVALRIGAEAHGGTAARVCQRDALRAGRLG